MSKNTLIFKGRLVPLETELQPEDDDIPTWFDGPADDPPTQNGTSPTKRGTTPNGVGTTRGATAKVPGIPAASSPKKPRKKSAPSRAAVLRYVSAVYIYGEDFNTLSVKNKLRAVGLVHRQDLDSVRQEAEHQKYIHSKMQGRNRLVWLNPDKELPDDLPAFTFRTLQTSCIEMDELDDSGPRESIKSPFYIRREAQMTVIPTMWAYYFSWDDGSLTKTDMRRFLHWCGDSLQELMEMLNDISADAREAAFRQGKRHIGTPKAYVYEALKNHAKDEGRTMLRWGRKLAYDSPFE